MYKEMYKSLYKKGKRMKKVVGQKHLYINNGIYYFRVVIPSRYRRFFEKFEIKKTLKTSNLRDAISKACEHTIAYHDKLKGLDDPAVVDHTPAVAILRHHSDAELEQISRAWLTELYNKEDIRNTAKRIPRAELLTELDVKIYSLEQAIQRLEPITGSTTWLVEHLINKHGVDFTGAERRREDFSDIVGRAQLEMAKRQFNDLHGRRGRVFDEELFSVSKFEQDQHNAVSDGLTIKEVVDQYSKDPSHSWAEKTRITYEHQHRLIVEFFGHHRKAKDIKRADCTAFREMIQQYPKNATKSFPNLTYEKAIKKAKTQNKKTLSISSQNDYLAKLSTIFSWAEKEDLIIKNPAKGLSIADPMRDQDKRHSYRLEQLETMFSSPLYTGCKDDERGYNKAGDHVIKRSRFWLPLLALFTGARLNELAQLDTADIIFTDDFLIIDINRNREDKKLKTKNSLRQVPVHPVLIKIGFQIYVEQKMREGAKKLFPELSNNQTGLYSQIPSKLFATWTKRIGAKEDRTSFHSFRHSFRDALIEAGVGSAAQKQICGWASSEVRENYGDGLKILTVYKEISKVNYQGLDLSHLYES